MSNVFYTFTLYIESIEGLLIKGKFRSRLAMREVDGGEGFVYIGDIFLGLFVIDLAPNSISRARAGRGGKWSWIYSRAGGGVRVRSAKMEV